VEEELRKERATVDAQAHQLNLLTIQLQEARAGDGVSAAEKAAALSALAEERERERDRESERDELLRIASQMEETRKREQEYRCEVEALKTRCHELEEVLGAREGEAGEEVRALKERVYGEARDRERERELHKQEILMLQQRLEALLSQEEATRGVCVCVCVCVCV
jgi:hypothetical protein